MDDYQSVKLNADLLFLSNDVSEIVEDISAKLDISVSELESLRSSGKKARELWSIITGIDTTKDRTPYIARSFLMELIKQWKLFMSKSEQSLLKWDAVSDPTTESKRKNLKRLRHFYISAVHLYVAKLFSIPLRKVHTDHKSLFDYLWLLDTLDNSGKSSIKDANWVQLFNKLKNERSQ
jgi:hypothetical protein